jgi:glutamate-1-semialdehyde aminotransferase
MAALERAWREARLKSEREHVTPYIWKHPSLFRLANVRNERDLSALRWTVDEPEDLEFARRVYMHLGAMPAFGMEEVLRLIEEQPQLQTVNAGFERNEGYQRSVRKDANVQPGEQTVSGTGQALYVTAKRRIPGGTQLLSKRPEMFLPDHWPAYYSKARGVDVWDLDGRRYVDMSCNGIGACVLGAGDPDVDSAVRAAIDAGVMCTLNCPEEVELADLLCELHPWADMVRYARGGGEAMVVAVRIARARTRRDRVAFCGYHGWHDWYLAANLAEEKALDGHLLPGLDPAGVPRALRGTALPFHYNRADELEAIVAEHATDLAAIVMEPIRGHDPAPGFLERVRDLATSSGAVLIFDEITAGFRLNTGGAHLLYGVTPDIAVFAKAMSNGYAMAAVIGTANVMQAAQDSFISSTYWTDRIGPAAALATIRKHRRCDVASHLIRIGTLLQDGWRKAAAKCGLSIDVSGIPPLSHFSFSGDQAQAASTLFTQQMLEHGFLAGTSFYATFAHQDEHVSAYLTAVEEVFAEIHRALEAAILPQLLRGPVAHSGFRRLT